MRFHVTRFVRLAEVSAAIGTDRVVAMSVAEGAGTAIDKLAGVTSFSGVSVFVKVSTLVGTGSTGRGGSFSTDCSENFLSRQATFEVRDFVTLFSDNTSLFAQFQLTESVVQELSLSIDFSTENVGLALQLTRQSIGLVDDLQLVFVI